MSMNDLLTNRQIELVYDLQKATEKLLEQLSHTEHKSGPELNLAKESAYKSISRIRVKFKKDFDAMLSEGKKIRELFGVSDDI